MKAMMTFLASVYRGKQCVCFCVFGTGIIARAFEKVVYKCFCKDTMDSYLSDHQSAYREGNCVDALLSIQDTVYGYLDNKYIKAVGLFVMDFSRAFDCVNHSLL